MIYSLTLTSKKDVGFLSVGGAVRTDTITFRITNLSIGDIYQWFVKANATDADIDAIAGDTGTIDQSTENITFALPSANFTVGSTYYFALREFNGSASQEVIQVAFTISQNAVLGQGTSVLNISPLFLPNFTTAGRDAIVTGSHALLIYNTTTEQIEQYNPDTDEWTALGGGGSGTWGSITGTLSNQTDLQTALNDKIDLDGENSDINYINFDATNAPAYQKGRVWYDNDTNALSYYDNISATSIQIGKELILDVRNNSGVDILNGEAVYITGSTGQLPTVAKAQANVELTSRIIGLATHNIDNNSNGKITVFGGIDGVNTGSYNAGDILYVSATTAGQLTSTPPASPNFVREVGIVTRANNSTGRIEVLYSKTLANNDALGTSQITPPTQNAVKTYADTKVTKTGDAIEGTFTNSDPVVHIDLQGDDSGNDAQENPVFRSTPYIDLATDQVSFYDGAEPDKGGYSELIRLQFKQPKAKPTIAWYDDEYKPVTWLVGHKWAQNLLIYPTFANFPVTGVNNNLTAYLDTSTGNGYYWNGSAYILLTPSDERWWYMWHHLHTSWESADSTGTSLFTRFGVRFGYNVVDVEVVNAHFRVKDGAHKNTNYGAFIVDSGRMYTGDETRIYPNATIRTEMLNKNDNVDNIFNSNSGALRLHKMEIGETGNPTGAIAIELGTDTGATRIVQSQNTTFTNKTGISGADLWVERASGDTVQHFSRGSGDLADANRRWSVGLLSNGRYGIVRRSSSGAFVNIPFVIDDTGRIGLNTSTPTSTIHFTGTTTIEGQVKGILAPTDANDATNKDYVDNPVFATTTAGNTPTIDARRGYFTTATLTTAAGNTTSLVITLNNSTILAGDIVIVNFDNYSATIGANGVPTVICASVSAGSASIHVRNTHPVNALNGTLRINFQVFTP